ncbi:PREDICTED: uncharacterized protein LOC109585491 [Amphimedon queenslandica]|uniref:Death domain-containing protein n=1 Tax=Amphimedon queenslandica TaxID=400682 RepID=A0AAN0JK53_AMPQE|nr:PREDICTED: uncharacterized protein LOC109585491 [Amphimedon queenslandica]|eukprot:XP_019857147.1 PREDICTED: uncharacterized protein LOC109585491 [Amphimedon queenslandica]
MAAVIKIFVSSAHHYMLIGNGLGVNTADLMQIPGATSTKLHLVFQRWFDADRDVNWDTLIKLCDDYPDELGKARFNLRSIEDTSISDDPSLASHSASSLSTSADPFVKRELTKSDHGTIMGLIDKDIAPKYKELAIQFRIPQGTIDTIAYNNRNNSAWDGLNDVVADWLRGNTEVYDEGVKASARWLYDAVRAIDHKHLGTKIAKEFGIPEQSDQSTQEADKGATGTGIEETDLEEPLGSTGVPIKMKKHLKKILLKISLNQVFQSSGVKKVL